MKMLAIVSMLLYVARRRRGASIVVRGPDETRRAVRGVPRLTSRLDMRSETPNDHDAVARSGYLKSLRKGMRAS